jgi:Skp family chaperone for outer membrane proteins
MRSTVLLTVLFLATSAFAREYKAAVVDMAKVFNEYPGTQRAK